MSLFFHFSFALNSVWWLQAFNKNLDKHGEIDTHVNCKVCFCHSIPQGSHCAPQSLQPSIGPEHCSIHFPYTLLNPFSTPKWGLGRENKTIVTQVSKKSWGTFLYTYLSFIWARIRVLLDWTIVSDLNVCKIVPFREP